MALCAPEKPLVQSVENRRAGASGDKTFRAYAQSIDRVCSGFTQPWRKRPRRWNGQATRPRGNQMLAT